MKLWTYHTEDLDLNSPSLNIDSTQGKHWEDSKDLPDFYYDQRLTQFQTHVGTDQILWCCTHQGTYPKPDWMIQKRIEMIEWEMCIPGDKISEKIVWVREKPWDESLRREVDPDWNEIIVEVPGNGVPEELDELTAVVKLPFPSKWIKRNGPVENDNRPQLSSIADIGKAPASHRFTRPKES